MRFSIREIVLWSRAGGFRPRRLKLDPHGVNVISGGSKTGKSAVIPIIDYCMGSDRCAIPVETIRDSCSWFGILADTEEGQKLFARREPGRQKSTGDMYILEGERVDVPDATPTKNITADAVKTRLDELSGLSKLSFDYDRAGTGFVGRPSLRDLVAFTFQPQNIVANPDVLFFKADTYEHREKLRTLFPYALGAMTPESLAAHHELRWLERKRVQRERELNALREVSERWLAELRASVMKARELGLLVDPVPPGATREDMLGLLTSVVDRSNPAKVTEEGISDAVGELLELDDEEANIDTELMSLRRRLAEMSRLRTNTTRYRDALTVQRDRLAIARWIRDLGTESETCPMCEGRTGRSEWIQALVDALEHVEADVRQSGSVSAAFDREMVRVKEDIALGVDKLEGIALRKSEAGSRTRHAEQARYRRSEIDRFLGRAEKALEMYESLAQGNILVAEVDELREREGALRRLIAEENVEDRTRRALEKVTSFAARLLPGLDAERPDEPIELSITDLTVKVKGRERVDYLWEIGSGANWLAYHVAVSLALQQFFLGNRPNPVPSFLVYDQPSQVYFPRQLAGARSKDVAADDPVLADEDVQAVRRVFLTISQVVRRSEGRLQTLVLDHAGPDVWDVVPGIHLVEEWRHGRTLIPMEWLR